MLKRKVLKFITENKGGDFNPSISIEEYRLAIKTYIEKADEGFLAAHIENGAVLIEALSVLTRFGESIIHLYKPTNLNLDKLAPCVIYFTGSGFVYSNPKWQARNCVDLAVSTNSIVLNIEDKCAPEHKFPKGLEECFAVIKWLFENGKKIGVDISDIRLCGFSSGGNFAAVLARWCMESSIPIQGQYLISPWLDLTCSHDSYVRFSKGYLLDEPVCDWLRHQYVTDDSQFKNSDVSPLLFPGDLSHLAPCTLIIAECEPFHDEAIAYTKRLKKDGVAIRLLKIPAQIHEYAGCNRWRLVLNMTEDPIAQVSLAVKFDRFEKLKTIMSHYTSAISLSVTSALYRSSSAFFRRLRDKYITEHRHDNPKIRREYDERFGIVLFNGR